MIASSFVCLLGFVFLWAVGLVPPSLPLIVRFPLIAVDVGLMLCLLDCPVVFCSIFDLRAYHALVAVVTHEVAPPRSLFRLLASPASVTVVAPIIIADSVVPAPPIVSSAIGAVGAIIIPPVRSAPIVVVPFGASIGAVAIADSVGVVSVTLVFKASMVVSLSIPMITVQPLGLMCGLQSGLYLLVVIPVLVIDPFLVGCEPLIGSHELFMIVFFLWQN